MIELTSGKTAVLLIITTIITYIVSPIIKAWASNFFSKKIDPLNEAIKHNSQVSHQLDLIIDELDCNRVWIAMFHNGGHFYPTGKSIQKFSVFYERILGKTESIMDKFQNIPISLYPKTFSKLDEYSELHLNFNELSPTDMDTFHRNNNTKSMYMFKIEDIEGRFIGIMAVEFDTKRTLIKENFIFIRQKIGIISSILTNYLIKQKN